MYDEKWRYKKDRKLVWYRSGQYGEVEQHRGRRFSPMWDGYDEKFFGEMYQSEEKVGRQGEVIDSHSKGEFLEAENQTKEDEGTESEQEKEIFDNAPSPKLVKECEEDIA
ncbi:hypothetical protein M9H77_07099 [Catharanthus roseus]|uniref:Uncharacterized protein n=1 Tax=Catharanthus roseus TaxID=4058 RepID=A0ACC0BU64_CATRO|nr:hypothetical protein M9H77_07099 [Catharanthus roseus]